MLNYRSYYIYQRKDGNFIVLDQDKFIISLERTLIKAKFLVDSILDAGISTAELKDLNDNIPANG